MFGPGFCYNTSIELVGVFIKQDVAFPRKRACKEVSGMG
jgi:hypothetical protein